MPEASEFLITTESLVSGYGGKEILHGVSLGVAPGEVVALIGHNGAGKSTLLKSVFGLVPIWQGRILFQAKPLPLHTPRSLLRLGVVYVPQGNRVFAHLSVRENLEMAGITIDDGAIFKESFERVLTLFPPLKSRLHERAGVLSGGEKQMLTLANAFILTPRLLLLDEPSLGLGPQFVSRTLTRIQEISKNSGCSVLIVEQKVREVLKIAERVYVLRHGLVTFTGSTEMLDDERLRQIYL